MSDLFFDDGKPFDGDVADIQKDGRGRFVIGHSSCNRCSGEGKIWWSRLDGGRCFRCGGDRTFQETFKVRLVTQRVLDNRAKRQAKELAEHEAKLAVSDFHFTIRKLGALGTAGLDVAIAAREGWGRSNDFDRGFWHELWEEILHGRIEAVERMLPTARKILADEAEAAGSEFFGAAGEAVEISGRILFTKHFDNQWGGSTLNKILTDDGNVVIHWGRRLGSKGDAIEFRATVKKHERFDDVAQTVVQRPRKINLQEVSDD